MSEVPVIAIDGPGGAGKGTLSRALAQCLDWHLLDSGRLYRGLALAVEKHGLDVNDGAALSRSAAALDLEFRVIPGQETEIMLEGVDVGAAIGGEACGELASRLAAMPEVRSALLDRQRAFRRMPGLVADGRDMGTLVFADAQLKIYLDASTEERAKRRYKQLKRKGFNVSVKDLEVALSKRDARDSQRKTAPLMPADDAVVIDTTTTGIKAVVEKARRLVSERFDVVPKPWN